jgi:hypothetical protein
MPPLGRRAPERNVFSFEGRLLAPPELVIDTSFVVDALVTRQPRHDACRAFLDTIRDSGSVVYFNMLLVAELWEVRSLRSTTTSASCLGPGWSCTSRKVE